MRTVEASGSSDIHDLTEGERALCQRVSAVADELADVVRQADVEGGYGDAWRSAIARLHSEGLFAMSIPAAYGGSGVDLMALVLVQERLARVDAGLANCISHEATAAQVLLRADETLCRDSFARMLAGSLTCIAITEPHSGSDLGAMRTEAHRISDGYVIEGEKTIASLAGVADIFLIWAMTDRAAGSRGLSTFWVDGSDAGISVGPVVDTLGFRQLPHHQVSLTGVHVPETARIGAEGEGLSVFAEALNVGRLGGAAQSLGIAQGAYELARAFARERVTFGRPIVEHQAIQFKLADMITSLEAGRSLLYRVTRFMQDRGDLGSREAGVYSAMVKAHESDMAMRVAEEAVQIFGAQGTWRSNDVERLFRDAKVTQIVDGPNELMRMRIGHEIARGRL